MPPKWPIFNQLYQSLRLYIRYAQSQNYRKVRLRLCLHNLNWQFFCYHFLWNPQFIDMNLCLCNLQSFLQSHPFNCPFLKRAGQVYIWLLRVTDKGQMWTLIIHSSCRHFPVFFIYHVGSSIAVAGDRGLQILRSSADKVTISTG